MKPLFRLILLLMMLCSFAAQANMSTYQTMVCAEDGDKKDDSSEEAEEEPECD